MPDNNLLVISNNFPNKENTSIGGIFVKEQIKCLKNYFDTIYVVSPVAYGVEYLREAKFSDYNFDNIKVFYPKYFNNPFFWKYMKSFWIAFESRAVQSLIEREHLRFNLIHAHYTWPSGAIAVTLKQQYHVPVFITEHTSKTFQTAVTNHDTVWERTLKSADAIIRTRKGDLELFDAMHVSKEKVHPVPNGFDPELFFPRPISECRKKFDLPANKKILLYVGHLGDPWKGSRFFIEAIGHVVQERQDIYGIIVGSGKLEKQMQGLIEKLQLFRYIHLVGSKPHSEIPLWMNACDLFILPSLLESFGIVQVEALACGKPVVATRNGGSEEIIISEKYGLLAEPANARDLADKILLALDRDWDQKEITSYAGRFTWKRIAGEIMEVYRSVGTTTISDNHE